jgi:hypothetical protein
MLEQLLNSLKAEIGGSLTSQSDVPAEHLDNVISSIGGVAQREIAGQLSSGNLLIWRNRSGRTIGWTYKKSSWRIV